MSSTPPKTFFRFALEPVNYMKFSLNDQKLHESHSVTITRVFCYLREQNYSHWTCHLECFCYAYRLMNLLRDKLIQRNDQK